MGYGVIFLRRLSLAERAHAQNDPWIWKFNNYGQDTRLISKKVRFIDKYIRF